MQKLSAIVKELLLQCNVQWPGLYYIDTDYRVPVGGNRMLADNSLWVVNCYSYWHTGIIPNCQIWYALKPSKEELETRYANLVSSLEKASQN